MNIYFAGSISGGRKYQPVYQIIVDYLIKQGYKVLTEHVAYPERKIHPFEINLFVEDMQNLKRCQVLIAEVSNPSTGVGYEVASALNLGKPVLCLYERGINISSLIKENISPHLQVYAYDTDTDIFKTIDSFLQKYHD